MDNLVARNQKEVEKYRPRIYAFTHYRIYSFTHLRELECGDLTPFL